MALNISDTLKMLEKSPIAANIQDIIQKLTELQAETVRHSKKQITTQLGDFSPISKEAFKFLDKNSQQELAILIGRIYCGPLLSPEEIERMGLLIKDAKEKQEQAYYTKGLESVEKGDCGLIALETCNFLEAKFRDALLRLLGKQSVENGLSDDDKKCLGNLIQLANLKQGNAPKANVSFFPKPPEPVSSLVYRSLGKSKTNAKY